MKLSEYLLDATNTSIILENGDLSADLQKQFMFDLETDLHYVTILFKDLKENNYED